MNKTLVESISLFCKDASSDKEYNIFLSETSDGFLVDYTNGRRGQANAGGTKTTSPVTHETAKSIYDKLVKEKMAKGYKPGEGSTSGVSSSVANKETGLYPQLLNSIDENQLELYFEDDDYVMQEKLDGKRITTKSDGQNVISSNRKGLECGIPIEIANELLSFESTFDGELIGSKYYVFDILETSNGDMRNEPFEIRNLFLEIMMFNGHTYSHIKPVKTAKTTEEKRNLYNKLKTDGKEGIVIKNKYAPYTSGRPSSGGPQLKYKFWESCTAKVIKVNDKRSVEVGVESRGSMVSVGNVTIPANYEIPKTGNLVEVKYLYAYEGGCLYQPIYLGERDDLSNADSLSTLKFK